METIKQFLVDNWQFISSAILALLSVIILIIKKRPMNIKAVLHDHEIWEHLICWIKEAENKFGDGHGDEKMQYVLKQFSNYEDLGDQMWYWEKPVKEAINLILSTPQRHRKVK